MAPVTRSVTSVSRLKAHVLFMIDAPGLLDGDGHSIYSPSFYNTQVPHTQFYMHGRQISVVESGMPWIQFGVPSLEFHEHVQATVMKADCNYVIPEHFYGRGSATRAIRDALRNWAAQRTD